MEYAEKVTAIAEQIAPHLKETIDPKGYAERILENARSNDQTDFEVRGIHTNTGNPYPFAI
jgi:hypothetical protein